MTQLDMFATPTRYNDPGCFADVRHDAGAYTASYELRGFCGGSGRSASLADALDWLASAFAIVLGDCGSVCTASHKATAARALAWIDQQRAACLDMRAAA